MEAQRHPWSRGSLFLGGGALALGSFSFLLVVPGEQFMLVPDLAVPLALGAMALSGAAALAGLGAALVALARREGKRCVFGMILSLLALLPPLASAAIGVLAVANM